MLPFWEVADRAINSGRLKKVKDFDFNLFNTVTRLVKEFGVKYDSKVPIPADDELADRIFEAPGHTEQCRRRRKNAGFTAAAGSGRAARGWTFPSSGGCSRWRMRRRSAFGSTKAVS